jgi:DNA-binding NarL/FixJ family response regulator
LIRVFIADDSEVVRSHLVELFAELTGIQVVGQTGDSPGAIRGILEAKPDLIVLDIQMPGGNALEVLVSAKSASAPPVVVVFTQHDNFPYRARFIQAGADAFFGKGAQLAQLIEFVRTLADAASSEPAEAKTNSDISTKK